MMTKNVQETVMIAELSASRLIHELVGPIGSISNGLELVSELGVEAGSDVSNLVNAGAEQARARLQFYRMAYGRAGYALSNVTHIRASAIALFQDAPYHTLNWPLPPLLPSLQEGVGRIALLLCEVARDGLPKGGTIEIDIQDNRVSAYLAGHEASLPEDLKAALLGTLDIEAHTPKTIHGALANSFARAIGWHIDVIPDEMSFELKAVPKG